MYQSGKDTGPIICWLLHAASRLSLDGLGYHVLPSWADEDKRDAFLHDLLTNHTLAVGDVPQALTAPAIATLQPRLRLKLLGVHVQRNLRHFVIPGARDTYS